MNLKFNAASSGSCGNCYFLETDEDIILVDIGINKKSSNKIFCDLSPDKGIHLFITHEHTDHISGLKHFAKDYNPHIYASEGTILELQNKGFSVESYFILDENSRYNISNFAVNTFRINHDAKQPLGYSFYMDGKKITFATDFGIADNTILDNLAGSNLIVLESNYDEDMLIKGKYPNYLKQRIISKNGHLSNKDALRAVSSIYDTGLERLFFAHISEENNSYDMVQKYVDYCVKNLKIETSFIRQGESFFNLVV